MPKSFYCPCLFDPFMFPTSAIIDSTGQFNSSHNAFNVSGVVFVASIDKSRISAIQYFCIHFGCTRFIFCYDIHLIRVFVHHKMFL